MSDLKYNSTVVLKARQEGKTVFGSAVADDLLREIQDLRAKLAATNRSLLKIGIDLQCERDEARQKISELQVVNGVLRGALEKSSQRLALAYETMNWFASGESMKEYRKIEPADILVEVYQGLAPILDIINQALSTKTNKEGDKPCP